MILGSGACSRRRTRYSLPYRQRPTGSTLTRAHGFVCICVCLVWLFPFLASACLLHTCVQDGWTPLNSAADSGHEGVVRLLLDSKAAVDTAENVSLDVSTRMMCV